MLNPDFIRIVEPPFACMTGESRRTLCLQMHDAIRFDDVTLAGGPLDAPSMLPMGCAWNYEFDGVHISYGSVMRRGLLL